MKENGASEHTLSNVTDESPKRAVFGFEVLDKGTVLKIRKVIEPIKPANDDSNTVSPTESQERLKSLQ